MSQNSPGTSDTNDVKALEKDNFQPINVANILENIKEKQAETLKSLTKLQKKNDKGLVIQTKTKKIKIKPNDTNDSEGLSERTYNEYGLNANQELFCREYVKHSPRNGSEAYLKVYGCSKESSSVRASEMLSNRKILSRITALEGEFIAQNYISRDNVLSGLWEVYQKCTNAVAVTDFTGKPIVQYVTDDDGNEVIATTQWKFDSKGAVSSLQAIGKYLGLFNADTSGGSHLNVTINNEMGAVRDLIADRMQAIDTEFTSCDHD